MTAAADDDLRGRLAFVEAAAALKDTLRSAHTPGARQESTAEHSWRLALLAWALAGRFDPPVDLGQILKLCLVHDLGEALGGDVPAPLAAFDPGKSARERRDLQTLTAPLPPALQSEMLQLWDDYEHGRTREARLVKGLDKLETILTHVQGVNPPGFDHRYNLQYGRKAMGEDAVLQAVRALLDARSAALARAGEAACEDGVQARLDLGGSPR